MRTTYLLWVLLVAVCAANWPEVTGRWHPSMVQLQNGAHQKLHTHRPTAGTHGEDQGFAQTLSASFGSQHQQRPSAEDTHNSQQLQQPQASLQQQQQEADLQVEPQSMQDARIALPHVHVTRIQSQSRQAQAKEVVEGETPLQTKLVAVASTERPSKAQLGGSQHAQVQQALQPGPLDSMPDPVAQRPSVTRVEALNQSSVPVAATASKPYAGLLAIIQGLVSQAYAPAIQPNASLEATDEQQQPVSDLEAAAADDSGIANGSSRSHSSSNQNSSNNSSSSTSGSSLKEALSSFLPLLGDKPHFLEDLNLTSAQEDYQQAAANVTELEVQYETASSKLLNAELDALDTKAAADAADTVTQSKQGLFKEATAARDAAQAAYDFAQQELQVIEQAAQNASAALVSFSSTVLEAEAQVDKKQMAAFQANQRVRATERKLQNLKSRLVLARAKQQSVKLHIKYAQMNMSEVEAELQQALTQQAATSAALGVAVREKLSAEDALKAAMTIQPLAAKLLSGVQNASFQANATRDAATQAVLEAQHKLGSLEGQLQAIRDGKHAAQAMLLGVPAQWGLSQFQVAGAAGAVWAAEAAWADASQKVEMQKAAVVDAQNAVLAAMDNPAAQLAHQALQAANGRLKASSAVVKKAIAARNNATAALAQAQEAAKKAQKAAVKAPTLLLKLETQIRTLEKSSIPSLRAALDRLKSNASMAEAAAATAADAVAAAQGVVMRADEKAAAAELAWQNAEDRVDALLQKHTTLISQVSAMVEYFKSHPSPGSKSGKADGPVPEQVDLEALGLALQEAKVQVSSIQSQQQDAAAVLAEARMEQQKRAGAAAKAEEEFRAAAAKLAASEAAAAALQQQLKLARKQLQATAHELTLKEDAMAAAVLDAQGKTSKVLEATSAAQAVRSQQQQATTAVATAVADSLASQQRLIAATAELQNLKAEETNILLDLSAAQKQQQQLQQLLASANASALATMDVGLSRQFKKQMQDLQQQLATVAEQQQQLSDVRAAAGRTIKAAQVSVSSITLELQAKQQAVDSAKEAMARATAAAEAADAAVESAKHALASVEAQATTSKSALLELQHNLNSTSDAARTAKSNLQKAQAEVQRLKAVADALKQAATAATSAAAGVSTTSAAATVNNTLDRALSSRVLSPHTAANGALRLAASSAQPDGQPVSDRVPDQAAGARKAAVQAAKQSVSQVAGLLNATAQLSINKEELQAAEAAADKAFKQYEQAQAELLAADKRAHEVTLARSQRLDDIEVHLQNVQDTEAGLEEKQRELAAIKDQVVALQVASEESESATAHLASLQANLPQLETEITAANRTRVDAKAAVEVAKQAMIRAAGNPAAAEAAQKALKQAQAALEAAKKELEKKQGKLRWMKRKAAAAADQEDVLVYSTAGHHTIQEAQAAAAAELAAAHAKLAGAHTSNHYHMVAHTLDDNKGSDAQKAAAATLKAAGERVLAARFSYAAAASIVLAKQDALQQAQADLAAAVRELASIDAEALLLRRQSRTAEADVAQARVSAAAAAKAANGTAGSFDAPATMGAALAALTEVRQQLSEQKLVVAEAATLHIAAQLALDNAARQLQDAQAASTSMHAAHATAANQVQVLRDHVLHTRSALKDAQEWKSALAMKVAYLQAAAQNTGKELN